MVTMVKLLMSTVAWLLLAGRGCASPATKWAEESEVWEQQLDMVLDNQEVRPGYIYISHCTCIYLRVYLHISTCVSTQVLAELGDTSSSEESSEEEETSEWGRQMAEWRHKLRTARRIELQTKVREGFTITKEALTKHVKLGCQLKDHN